MTMQEAPRSVTHQERRYTDAWFAGFQSGTLTSARVVVPIVMDLIRPLSVVDVGCATGGWLATFMHEGGVPRVCGVDGPWVDREKLLIPKEYFRAVDLDKPLTLDQHADLAICLEVAEHLPSTAASILIDNLTAIAPVVLFSAAIPHQGGTGHVNEQWPDYWAALFKARGFVPVDCIRRKIWEDPAVKYWYAQNMLVYVKQSELFRYPSLEAEIAAGYGTALPLVHPQKYLTLFVPKRALIFRVLGRLRRIMERR